MPSRSAKKDKLALSYEEIKGVVMTKLKQCNDCHRLLAGNKIRLYKNLYKCKICQNLPAHVARIEKVKQQIHQYHIKNGKDKCAWCNIQLLSLDGEKLCLFEADHIDPFTKGDSICNMLFGGQPIELIYKELDKCRNLCISCHAQVTQIEATLGLTAKSKNKPVEWQQRYKAKYAEIEPQWRKEYISNCCRPSFSGT